MRATGIRPKRPHPLHGWIHIKAIIKGKTLTVFVGDASTPVMVYKNLDSGLKSGSAGYWLGNSAVAACRKLQVTNW